MDVCACARNHREDAAGASLGADAVWWYCSAWVLSQGSSWTVFGAFHHGIGFHWIRNHPDDPASGWSIVDTAEG